MQADTEDILKALTVFAIWAMMVTIALIALLGCKGYSPAPYAEVRYRDETFSDDTRHDSYYGESYHVGVRFVPPVQLEDYQLTRIEHAIRGQPAPVAVADKPSHIEEIGKLGKDSDGNWSAWGAAVVIGLLLFGGEVMRRRVRSSSAAERSSP